MDEEQKSRFKAFAEEIGVSWAERQIKGYQEPVRKGTPKGDPIGLSAQKMKAALLMILHNPRIGQGLKEIAGTVGTSDGVLRVWRTRKDFKAAEAQGIETFSKQFFNSLHYYASGQKSDRPNPLLDVQVVGFKKHDILLRVLPYFNESVIKQVVRFMNAKLDAGDPLYPSLIRNISLYIELAVGRNFKSWLKHPETRELWKDCVEICIRSLSNPTFLDNMKGERTNLSEGLIKLIFQAVDALAE